MAATLTLSSGTATYVGSDGVNNSLTISLSGTTYTYADTAETITLSGFPGTTTGDGTNTITFSTLDNTVTSLVVQPGTGTNITNLRSLGLPTSITTTGTDTVNLSGNAPSQTGSTALITANVTVTATVGSVTIDCQEGNISAGADISVGSSTVTGLMGDTGSRTLTYSESGGTITLLRLRSTTVLAAKNWTIDNPPCPLTTTAPSSVNADYVYDVLAVTGGDTTLTGGNSGADTFTVGTAAGSTAGCDEITSALTLSAGTGSGSSFHLDDSGSATGSKIYTLSNSSCTGFGSVTITYSALGGNFSGGATFEGSEEGNCTFTITQNFSSTTFANGWVIIGNGGNTNTLDLSALSNYTVSGGVGSGIVTLSTGKTITYSGIGIFIPALTTSSSRTTDGKSF